MVERRIARTEELLERSDRLLEKSEQRLARAEQRDDKAEKEVAAIRKLIRYGMKMLAEANEKHKENEVLLHTLMDHQLRSDQKMDRLIEVLLRKNTNGRRAR